jgi:hypothetical protein
MEKKLAAFVKNPCITTRDAIIAHNCKHPMAVVCLESNDLRIFVEAIDPANWKDNSASWIGPDFN